MIIKYMILILLLFFSLIIPNNKFFYFKNDFSTDVHIQKTHTISETEMKYIAHAGGALNDITYLNNLESIRNSYNKGFRLIELDVEYTTDNKPVMLHSWDGFITKFFGVEAWRKYSLEEFKNFKMINDWHQLTLDDTIYYMKNEFTEMYLITDTKGDNKLLLDIISIEYPDMKKRIIPQVYNQEEYAYAKNLGFENIIYTLYMSTDTNEEIIDFCKQNTPFAITMPKDLACSELPLELAKLNIYTYTHTVNDISEYTNIFVPNGIKGIYTDTIYKE